MGLTYVAHAPHPHAFVRSCLNLARRVSRKARRLAWSYHFCCSIRTSCISTQANASLICSLLAMARNQTMREASPRQLGSFPPRRTSLPQTSGTRRVGPPRAPQPSQLFSFLTWSISSLSLATFKSLTVKRTRRSVRQSRLHIGLASIVTHTLSTFRPRSPFTCSSTKHLNFHYKQKASRFSKIKS